MQAVIRAWNLPLYKMSANPFNTAGLVIDQKMHAGFTFEVYGLFEEKRIIFDCPADLYNMLMYIGAPARYVIHSIRSKTLAETAAATSTQRLSLIAGKLGMTHIEEPAKTGRTLCELP